MLEGARGFAQHVKDQGEIMAKVTALGKELEDAAKATDPAITSKIINKVVDVMAEETFDGLAFDKFLNL